MRRSIYFAITILSILWARSAHAESSPAPNGWQKPTKVEIGLLIVAESLIVVDVLQSLDIKNHPRAYESNPLLGEHPSDRTFILAGGLSLLTTLGLWYLLPTPWRDAVTVSVIFVEAPNTAYSAALGYRMRLP